MKNTSFSYCVATAESCALTRKIREWIKEKEEEGWVVELIVKEDDGQPVVMWQCVKHKDGLHERMEFTDCIGMDGRIFAMN